MLFSAMTRAASRGCRRLSLDSALDNSGDRVFCIRSSQVRDGPLSTPERTAISLT